jgi:glycosyltransferase involved in cell wall biosynthesis
VRALIVRGPYKGTSGHDHHVREFVRHLAARSIRLQLSDVPEWAPAKLPDDRRDPWFDTLGAAVDAQAVLHFCMPHQVRPVGGRLNVNFTMFEATRIPPSWLAHNLRHDLVIVPTWFCERLWTDSGFPPERIRICPLGVDARRFHPHVEPLELVDRRGRPVREYRARVLNVSELVPRKNLLGLLRVWIRSTTPSDDAILILKLPRSAPGVTVRFLRDLAALEAAIGKSREASAAVLFVDEPLSDGQMPALFAAATHYWSMSRGEAWDQPMMEAGATGLRLIAPEHSAYTVYLDESTATLIPARRQPVAVHARSELGRLFKGADWWEPDEDTAVRVIRAIARGAHPDGPTARSRLAAEFTWDRAADRLVAILEELHTAHGRIF